MEVQQTNNLDNMRKEEDEVRFPRQDRNQKLKKQQISCLHIEKVLENVAKKQFNNFLKKLVFRSERSAKYSKICMKIWRHRLRGGFLKLKKYNFIQNSIEKISTLEFVQHRALMDNNNKQEGIDQKRISSIKELITQFSKAQQIQRVGHKKLKDILHSLTLQKPEATNYTRINTQLQIRNNLLQLQNQIYTHTLEEMNKRQNKQNLKKKESLQMLAEQIQQKNQEIFALKKTVKAYKQTYENQSNVLQTEAVSLRKEVDHLQSVRNKLYIQVDRYKDQIVNLQSDIEKMRKMINQLEIENTQMKNKVIETQIKFVEIGDKAQQFDIAIKKIQEKLRRLSFYEKNRILNIETQVKLSSIKEETKSQYMIFYLKNLQFRLKQLEIPSIFSREEMQILNNHRLLWSKYISRQKEQIDAINCKRMGQQQFQISDLQLSGIQGKGMMASVFHALGKQQDRDMQRRQRKKSSSSRNGRWEKQERNNENQDSNNNIRNRVEHKIPSLTIKMLELELERNKQIEKIQELKQKFLHIRVIILNFLKCLELQHGGKKQVMDILRVLFDLFEYSEEERESIFSKKKKFFSLF